MIGLRTVAMLVLGMGMSVALCAPVMAQQGGGGRGGRGGGQRFDPAAMRERMQQQLKEELGVNDDEWKVLQPKLDKVQQARMADRAGGGRQRFGGRQGGGGDGAAAPAPAADTGPQSPLASAARELRDVLDNKDSTAEQIKGKLQAYRDARAKADADLIAAEAELKELLTARQEAVLVSRGMLK